MIKTILAVIGAIVVILVAGSFALGFITELNEPSDSIINENITIDYIGGQITPQEGYSLINSTEYGLCIKVPLKYYPISIFEPNTTIKINNKEYEIVDYIELNTDGQTNDLVAVNQI